jgi:hypothetical protein
VHRSGSSNKNYNKGLRQELKEGAVVGVSTETLQHTTVATGEPTTAVIGYHKRTPTGRSNPAARTSVNGEVRQVFYKKKSPLNVQQSTPTEAASNKSREQQEPIVQSSHRKDYKSEPKGGTRSKAHRCECTELQY